MSAGALAAWCSAFWCAPSTGPPIPGRRLPLPRTPASRSSLGSPQVPRPASIPPSPVRCSRLPVPHGSGSWLLIPSPPSLLRRPRATGIHPSTPHLTSPVALVLGCCVPVATGLLSSPCHLRLRFLSTALHGVPGPPPTVLPARRCTWPSTASVPLPMPVLRAAGPVRWFPPHCRYPSCGAPIRGCPSASPPPLRPLRGLTRSPSRAASTIVSRPASRTSPTSCLTLRCGMP